jgi:hypothetical protein
MTLNLIENIYLEEQYRFPRSKKKRIQKKWKRDKRNWGPMRGVIVQGDNFYGHPSLIIPLRLEIARLAKGPESISACKHVITEKST